MALKVELKPHERIIIGACVITNTDQRARLLIDGDKIPILREKDILTPDTADTPAKLVYLAVQLMYISPDPPQQARQVEGRLAHPVILGVPRPRRGPRGPPVDSPSLLRRRSRDGGCEGDLPGRLEVPPQAQRRASVPASCSPRL